MRRKLNMERFAKDYAEWWEQYQELEKNRMSVRWSVRSEEIHHSKATWVGVKPRDGGLSLLTEMFNWIRENQQTGRMIVDFGTGGSVSSAEFEQRERIMTPPVVFDSNEVIN